MNPNEAWYKLTPSAVPIIKREACLVANVICMNSAINITATTHSNVIAISDLIFDVIDDI